MPVLVAHKDRVQGSQACRCAVEVHWAQRMEASQRVYTPWGAYDSIDAEDRFQVKRITVRPGAALSCRCTITGPNTGSLSRARRESRAAMKVPAERKSVHIHPVWHYTTGLKIPAASLSN